MRQKYIYVVIFCKCNFSFYRIAAHMRDHQVVFACTERSKNKIAFRIGYNLRV